MMRRQFTDCGLHAARSLLRCLILVAAPFLIAGASPAVGQTTPPASSAQQRPVHLVVFNKPGPNYARLDKLRRQALQHRDMYLKWADDGEIIASGLLEGTPVLGLTVFRRGADEPSIRRSLSRDPLVTAGVLDIELRHWTIQMGALPANSRAD